MAAVTVDDTDTDDLDALYASVTPGAHRDLVSGGKADRKPQPLATAQPVAQPARPAAAAPAAAAGARRHTRSTRPRPAAQVVAPAPASAGPWKWVAIFASIALAVLVVGFVVVPFVFNLGGGGAPGSSDAAAHASPTAPAVDQAKVSALMAKLQANPNDTASLQALGDEFFAGQEYSQAATFYDQLLALEPNNIAALLARGATYYNLGDSINSEKLWKQVVALNPTDKGQAQEVHYDLGFLYLNSATPNWDGVQSEWNQVIAIDATTQLAKTVQQHLDSLASASMIPAASGATPSGSAAPSGSAVPSVAASPSSSLAAGASPASTPVSEGALNGAFTSGTLNAPANTPFTIHFNNQDSGVPNDMLIKDSAGNTVFKGDMVTGPAAVDYAVPALAPGTYTFVSTIHPTTMNGTLVVGS
jgi:plastocyanin